MKHDIPLPFSIPILVKVNASGCKTYMERTSIEVIKEPDDADDTSIQNDSTDTEINSSSS